MDNIPTLNDQIDADTVGRNMADMFQLPSVTDKNLFAPTFFKFFFLAEELRQRLFEKFEYKVNRRIENYPDGTLAVKFICPAYGRGEPGSQPRQVTLTVDSLARPESMDLALGFLSDAFNFFVKKQEMDMVASSIINQLTPAQREALRWSLPAAQ